MSHVDKVALGVGFLLSGGMTTICAYARFKGQQTDKWLKRFAKIIDAKIATDKDAEHFTSYAPRIKYEYVFKFLGLHR